MALHAEANTSFDAAVDAIIASSDELIASRVTIAPIYDSSVSALSLVVIPRPLTSIRLLTTYWERIGSSALLLASVFSPDPANPVLLPYMLPLPPVVVGIEAPKNDAVAALAPGAEICHHPLHGP